MTRAILIQGGRLIDPSRDVDEIRDLFIDEGKVVWDGVRHQAPANSDFDLLNASGLIVCPGFIDLHCHLRDPGFEEKETIATGSKAAAAGGFTTVCCMPNTEPPIDNRSVVDYVKKMAEACGVVRVLPIGCITRGRKGTELAPMGELAEAGVIGFSDDGSPVMNSRIMRYAMEYSRAFDLPIIDHCEDTALTDGGQMNEGIIASKMGLQGMPAAAEESMVARDIALAELTGARLHIAHVSTASSVEMVRLAKEKGIKITAEVTPHHLTLTEECVAGYNTDAKVNPPLRTRKDIEALVRGLDDNTIDAIATDHAPHTEADKLCEFAFAPSGISGLETALGILMKLVSNSQISLNLLIARLTSGPARIIGTRYGTLGSLAAGSPADVTLFDPTGEWTVDPRAFFSKGKNSPLCGAKLKGRVMTTVSQGKIVYRHEEGRPQSPDLREVQKQK